MKLLSQTRSGLLLALAVGVALVSGSATTAADTGEIGGVQLVRIWATGTPTGQSIRDLFVEDRIVRNEVVETVRDGALHLRFDDDTEFRLGSNSRATLDKFIYDPASKSGEFTVSLKEGIFRLKTGQMKKEGIRLLTAVALIEVQGTDLTIELLKDGTVRASAAKGKAVMTSFADGSQVQLLPGGDAGQVSPGGPAKPYLGVVGAGDTGIADGAAFETKAAIPTVNAGLVDGGLTEIVYQSASAGQTISALSPLAVFSGESRTALQTVVTGEALFAAAETPTVNVAALAPTIITDGIIDSNITNAVTNAMTTAQVVSRVVMPPEILFHLMIQWGQNAFDLDLHLTGPDGAGSRFHVYWANQGSLTEQPFASLVSDCICQAGTEVIAVSDLNEGDFYRASVFNFGDQSRTSANLSTESGVEFSLIQGGEVVPNPNVVGGVEVVGGALLTSVTPTPGNEGNTWIVGEIDPTTGQFGVTNEMTNSPDSGSVQ